MAAVGQCYTNGLLPRLTRAGEWFLHSGIQEPNGGVARYYCADAGCNRAVSTEITGYAASAYVYLHSLTRDPRYLEAALRAARFLSRTAWNAETCAMPFEMDPPALAYFFDCGIVGSRPAGGLARHRRRGISGSGRAGWAAPWRAISCRPKGGHPVLSLPDKRPLERDPARWSRASGCYQLKAAMAWWDLWEATGETEFREPYQRVLDDTLRTCEAFLPGHPDRLKVWTGCTPSCTFWRACCRAPRKRVARRPCYNGIRAVERQLRCDRVPNSNAPMSTPSFCASACMPIGRAPCRWISSAAINEANRLAEFQVSAEDPRMEGGYYFGRRDGDLGAARQPRLHGFRAPGAGALGSPLGNGGTQPHRHLLI